MRDRASANDPEPSQNHGGPGIVAICGNIGAGKSTLCTLLAAAAPFQLCLESPDEHWFVQRHYEQPGTWAFHNQVEFLARKSIQQQSSSAERRPALHDRCLDECHHVFSEFMLKEGLLLPEEHAVLRLLWRALTPATPKPAVVVYLHAASDVLMTRIALRGWAHERQLQLDWIVKLNRLYEEWIADVARSPGVHLISIDTTQTDYRYDADELKRLQRQIEEGLIW